MSNNIVYKLTDAIGQTRGKTQWGPGISHSGTGEGELCGPGWIHYYSHPLLAVLLNPIHANFPVPKLWEASAGGAPGEVKLDGGMKFGCKTLTTLREIPVPGVTTEQRVRFAIFCALEVSESAQFRKWAGGWLSGKDRSRGEALFEGSRRWAGATARAAESAAAWEATARAAAWEAAARAWESAAASAARAAAWAAEAAARAAEAAAREAACGLNFIALAERACPEF